MLRPGGRDASPGHLFEEMAAGYDRASMVGSFGVAAMWRRRLVRRARISGGDRVVDLMCGTGNLWPALGRRCRAGGSITGVDSSSAMCARARQRSCRAPVSVVCAEAQHVGLEPGVADVVACAFGVKTLDDTELDAVVAAATRLLRPGGRLALVEMTVPGHRGLRRAYLGHLRLAPLFAALAGADPRPHRALAGYVAGFGDGRALIPALLRHGLAVREWRSMTLGCAVLVVAEKADG
jgi:demethylmenaquinone methyltransferase/2-methoxy-6-polyprenyl-1,4-benzoquinol methylase